MTKNSGADWTEVNEGLPFGKWVSHIEASRVAEGRVYMTQNGKRDDDFAAYIWKSEDFGHTWENIKNNLPYGPANVIREDPKNENILYVGTDYGVFVSLNRGLSWETLTGNLPTTYVHDINIHPRDNIAVIATHGRGMWALDVNILHQLIEFVLSKTKAGIFDIPNCMLPYNMDYYDETVKKLEAPVYVKEAGKIKIKILDIDGEIVSEDEMEIQKGINYVSWNLLNNKVPVKKGEYKLYISGQGFDDKKAFEVQSFSSR